MAIERLFLLTDNYLPHRGGSRVYYHHLLTHLKGFRACVLTRAQAGDAAFDRGQPYRVIRCRLEPPAWLIRLKIGFLYTAHQLFWKSVRAIRRFRPEILMAGEMLPTGFILAWLGILTGKPMVLFTHAEGPATLSRTRLQSRLARWTCRRARAIVVSSSHARRLLEDLWRIPAEKIHVIEPGVGEEHLNPRHRARPFAAPEKPIRLLSVGRLVERKGHRHVLRALPELIREFPRIQYAIAGSGPLEAELKDLTRRLGLAKHVRFMGQPTTDALSALYAASDIFVLPNIDNPATGDTEGFGIVFVEAAAHGLPVIGGRTPGTKGAIRDGATGLRIDANDPQSLVDAIGSLLRDPARARSWGEAGHAFARNSMRWTDRAAMLEKVLRESA